MATLWRQDGGSSTVHPADGHGFTLEEMQEYAGADGWPVEIVFLGGPWPAQEGEALIVDDDGWAHGRRENAIASAIYREHGGVWPIVGDALEARYEALGTDQERWW